MLAPDGRVVVEVRDSGSGMSASVKKRLFLPFFSTRDAGAGAGMGLSICYRVITSFGGTITVDSTVGQGSVFRVHLPPAG
jgi:signal transduction histidine kinase